MITEQQTTDQNNLYQSLFKEHVPPPIDGDFDEVARLATEVLGVPFVYVSLLDFRSKKGIQKGNKSMTPENDITVSMAPKKYLSKGFPLQDPEKLKIALAKFNDLHFCATVPLFSSNGDRLGTLYTFDHSSSTWGDVHWEIMTVVGKIITYRVEAQWEAYQALISNKNATKKTEKGKFRRPPINQESTNQRNSPIRNKQKVA